MTLEQLTQQVLSFTEKRNWSQFHNPKDLALSLSLEAAELLELTQWKNGEDLERHLEEKKSQVEEELADVLYWVLLIANRQGIDLAEAFERKMQENERKYPVELSKGNSVKYTELK